MTNDVPRVMLVFGTRPEAIKMFPLIEEAKARRDEISLSVCVTSQHREMLSQVLDLFGISPDFNLDVMQDDQSLHDITSRVLLGIRDKAFRAGKPDWLIVQGDTTTTMTAALAAYYERVKIGHVEAGLRTYDRFSPYPEEVNRRICSVVADLHWAPTRAAKENLLRENVAPESVVVTGNTSIDTARYVTERFRDGEILAHIERQQPDLHRAMGHSQGRRIVLATIHRRESFGAPAHDICVALRQLAEQFDDIALICPMHPNRNIKKLVTSLLGDVPNVYLTPAVDYVSFVGLMKAAYLILSDSGGVQEEAAYFDKPILVLREVTERNEGVQHGVARLVGRGTEDIVCEASLMLTDSAAYSAIANATNPYGDGYAARRIFQSLLGQPVEDYEP